MSATGSTSSSNLYGVLIEKSAAEAFTRNFTELSPHLRGNKQLNDALVVARVKSKLRDTPGFCNLYVETHSASNARPSKSVNYSLNFTRLEADLWGTVAVEGKEVKDLKSQRLSVQRISLREGSFEPRSVFPAADDPAKGPLDATSSLVVIEATSNCTFPFLKYKLCQLERVLAYCEEQRAGSCGILSTVSLAVLATSLANDNVPGDLGSFLLQNAEALPRVSCLAQHGYLLFMNLPDGAKQIAQLYGQVDELLEGQEQLKLVQQQMELENRELRQQQDRDREAQEQLKLELRQQQDRDREAQEQLKLENRELRQQQDRDRELLQQLADRIREMDRQK